MTEFNGNGTGISVGNLPEFMVRDLANSGLVYTDLHARKVESPERARTQTPNSVQGYVLPYFAINGKPLPFYRVRLFEHDKQYAQPPETPNYVYFPKKFLEALGSKGFIIFTLGEKAATACVKAGLPAVGFSGLDGWRSRTILVSGDAALSQHGSKLAIRLPVNGGTSGSGTHTAGDGEPSGLEEAPIEDSPLAVGLSELIDYIVQHKLYVIIVFPTDMTDLRPEAKCSTEAQKHAAQLGFELRFRGVAFSHIRQLILPKIHASRYNFPTVGVDNYLVHEGHDKFKILLTKCLAARGGFPIHPNIRDYLNKRLQRAKVSRKEAQAIAMAVLSDVDSRGMRLRDSVGGSLFYFDLQSHRLVPAHWPDNRSEQYEAPFLQYMYKEYGISPADSKMLVWLGTQFSSEEPIEVVTPRRIMTTIEATTDITSDPDRIYYQVSDSEFVEVSASGFKFYSNGDMNVLFEANQTDPLDVEKLKAELVKQTTPADKGGTPLSCWWASTLSQVRLRDKDKQRVVCALLYYMSPWLFRWRGMQLPVELIVGESGSGKSTLCELRLDILSGRPFLRNAPSDVRDWHASIATSGGLHVTDNLQLVNKELRQRLSDEICRIVTEPTPYIEQRKLYTNSEIHRIPVTTVFAFTAIQQPFMNVDLLQRAFILQLDKSIEIRPEENKTQIKYDSHWKAHQLGSRGGREAWVAHHLVVLYNFFRRVKTEWDPNYSAKNRLINFEQAIMIMAKVFNIPAVWIPDFLSGSTDQAVSEADWVLEGLHAFSVEHNKPNVAGLRFPVSTISDWCSTEIEFKGCEVLVNVRKLGKYMAAHKSAIFHLTGIIEAGSVNNRLHYRFEGKTPMPKVRI